MPPAYSAHTRCGSKAHPGASLWRSHRAPQVLQRLCLARAASEAAVDANISSADTPGTIYGERGQVEKVCTCSPSGGGAPETPQVSSDSKQPLTGTLDNKHS
jgi:hypothetical protein